MSARPVLVTLWVEHGGPQVLPVAHRETNSPPRARAVSTRLRAERLSATPGCLRGWVSTRPHARAPASPAAPPPGDRERGRPSSSAPRAGLYRPSSRPYSSPVGEPSIDLLELPSPAGRRFLMHLRARAGVSSLWSTPGPRRLRLATFFSSTPCTPLTVQRAPRCPPYSEV